MKGKETGFQTKAIHAGQLPDPVTGAIVPPIYATSTYVQEAPGVHKGFEYSRTHNPTRNNLESVIAALENGKFGLAFASGLAATNTILEMFPSDSHIIAADDMYGGTYRLFERVKKPSSKLSATYVDMSDLKSVEAAIRPETKMIWAETPTNPLLKVIDLEAISAIGRKKGILTFCDNTFATPYIQKPLNLGFDVVVHSSTKYLNGHSDVVGGLVVIKENVEVHEKLRFLQNAIGAVPGPFDSYLTHRGIKTLALRMERHGENALTLAEKISGNSLIEEVIYPGLKTHPNHALAKKQMKNFGGMVSLRIKGGLEGAKKFMCNLKIFAIAESLGAVESLINHPAIMTHASIPKERREQLGITDGLVRLSVGVEDIDDLIEDVLNALR